MKMSDYFASKVTLETSACGGFTLKDAKCEYDEDWLAIILNLQQAKAITHAINNHDRMVEEIAELKGLVDNLKKDRSSAISLMSKSWQHGAEDQPMILTRFVEMANKQFELLAKLNQEGGE